jgi:hypothetical protein
MVLSKITPVDNFTVQILIIDVYREYIIVIFIITAVIIGKQYDLQQQLLKT